MVTLFTLAARMVLSKVGEYLMEKKFVKWVVSKRQ
jgi:hypothetical protein